MSDLQNTAANTANTTTTGTTGNGDDSDDPRTMIQQANAMLFVAALQKDINLRNNWTALLQKMNDALKPLSPEDKDKVYQEKISIIDNWLVNQGYMCQAVQVLALLKTDFYQEHLKESEPNADSDRFVQTTLSDTSLYNAWLGALKAVSTGTATNDSLNTFLTSRGYNCTYVQVNASFVKMRNHNMNYWTGIYADSTLQHGNDKAVQGPILIIYGDYSVSIDNLHLDKELNKVTYNNGTLTWQADDFTIPYSGNITFSQKVMATAEDKYVGNEYFGTITYPATGTAPYQGEVQVFGRIGDLTEDQKDKKIPPAVNPSAVDQAMKYIGYFMAGVFLIDFAASIPKRFNSIKEFVENVKQKLSSGEQNPEQQNLEQDINQMDANVQDQGNLVNDGQELAQNLQEAPLNEGNINSSDVIQDLQNELANSPSPERTQELEQQLEEQQAAEEDYDNQADEEANPEEEGGWGDELETLFEV